MTPLLFLLACGAPAAEQPAPPAVEQPPMEPAEQHARNLRFRDNRVVFEESARWLDAHRDEALPVMTRLLAEGGPWTIGIARVLGVMDDPRTVPALQEAMGAGDDELAYEAARALARTSGEEAEAALRSGASSADTGTLRNALRGIEERGDPGLCDAVTPHLDAADPIGTYAARAAEALHCH